jgi:gliding motility-associated-like protein
MPFVQGAAQTCPPNIGFEDGNFGFWELDPSGPTSFALRHELVTAASGNDPFGEFPMLCPYGGNYSVKLGNEQTGAETESISYTFTVPANLDIFTITYFYAIVLQNPDHTAAEQPRFQVSAYDFNTGAVIGCSTFDYVASGSLPGFTTSPHNRSVVYRKWTPGSVQIDGMAGRTVRLEFRTSDCTRGGHFGYAYIDVAATCSNILASASYCTQSNSLELSAPFGYQGYTWYSSNFSQVIGTTQSITLSPPPITSGFYWVDVVPYPGYGCRDTFKATIAAVPSPPTPQVPDTLYYCKDQAGPLSGIHSSPGCLLQWYTAAAGGSSLGNDPPVPPTNIPGILTYWVSQKVLFGCESERKPVFVKVVSSWPLSFTINSTRQCLSGNQFILKNTTPPFGAATFSWETADGNIVPAPFNTPVNHVYSTAGSFAAQLAIRNAGACSAVLPIPVNVLPKPAAVIGLSGAGCTGMTATPVVDSSITDPGDPIVSWWWKVGGLLSTAQVPPSMPLLTGTMTAQLAVVSTEGCRSDTVLRTITIGSRPMAAFNVQTACSNVPVQLRDASYLPGAGPGERVAGWQWRLDGAALSTDQHPFLMLPGGTHSLQLTVESNYGCRSAGIDSVIVVQAAPDIGLSWDDSCVAVPVHLQAQALSGNVTQWWWRFGGGTLFSAGPSTQVQRYGHSGQYLLSLVGQNSAGCKDTLMRSITIYDIPRPVINDTIAAIDEAVLLDGYVGAGAHYSWSPAAGLSSDTIARPQALLDYDQRYSLLAVSAEGCRTQAQVLVRRMMGPEIYVPDAFTPNNDGRNDLLRPIIVGIRTLHYFAIYDRNGQRVFFSSNPREGWDGMRNGQPMTTSTFVYMTEGTDFRGRRILRKGTVTLVR